MTNRIHNAEEITNTAFETTVFHGANRTPWSKNYTKIQRNEDILHEKDMRYDDLDTIPTKLAQNKVKEAERDENLKEESKKDVNGVGKLEDIEAYSTPWTRNSKTNQRNQQRIQ